MDMTHLEIPRGSLPDCLARLRTPATKDEALAHAESCGAPEALLAFLEALPAAVFSSDEGMRHALSGIPWRDYLDGDVDVEPPAVSEDGTDN